MKKALSLFSVFVGSVMVASAQTTVTIGQTANQGTVNITPLMSLLGGAQAIVEKLVPFFIGLAVVVFFWYMIVFIVKGNEDAEKKSASLKGMGYAILAIFAMVALWGLIGLISSMLGVGLGGGAPIPTIPTGNAPAAPRVP